MEEFENLFIEILDLKEELTIYEQNYINDEEPMKSFDRAREVAQLLTTKSDQLMGIVKALVQEREKGGSGPTGIGSAT